MDIEKGKDEEKHRSDEMMETGVGGPGQAE